MLTRTCTHICFIFTRYTQVEIRMLQYLSRKFATTHRISIERLVSGNGLANVSIKHASHHINNGKTEVAPCCGCM